MEETPYAQRGNDAGGLVLGLLGGARLARILWMLSLALVASALLLDLSTPDFLLPAERPRAVFVVAPCLLAVAGSSVGALIVSRLPRNPVGWILCGMGLLYGSRRLAETYADYALLARTGLPLGEQAAWVSTWLRFSILIALGTLLVLLFPDGRFLAPRWRIVALAAGGGAILVALGNALRAGPLPTYYYVNNPFGIGGALREVPTTSFAEASTIVGGGLLSVSCLASIAALALRLRLAYGPERRHLEWFAYAAVPALFISVVVLLNWSIERFGSLFLGRTTSPVLWVAENTVWFGWAGQTAGTMIELSLDANLEFLSACALLMMPICTYAAIRNHGLYGVGSAAVFAAPRWLQAFFGGTIAGAMPLVFVYLSVYLYVVLYPLGGRGELGGERLGQVAGFVSGWGAHAFFFTITFLVALRVARKGEERPVVLGTLVGLIAAFVDQMIAWVVDPPVTPGGIATYLFLGLAGGYFGGLTSRSTLSGGVYRVSRQIGKAKTPSAVAGAIGENLGSPAVDGVALWQVAGPDDHNAPVEASPRRESPFVLWGFWRANGQEDWPSGLDPGQEGATLVVAPGERSWALVKRPALAPGKQRSWEQLGIRSAFLVPLVVPGEAWKGLLMVAFRKRLRFFKRDARAYLTMASQAALALENLRLVDEARRAGHEGGILIERQRLAWEIHDTLAQGFTAVITNLTAAELATEPHVVDAPSARHIEDAKRIARESLAETRRLVWALRPASLDRYPLPEAVDRLAKAWADRTGVEAVVATNGAERELLPEAEVALLRAAEEALTNVHKHARASTVHVTLTFMEDRTVIDVLDDGDGFDPAAVTTAVGAQDEGGFGLTAMRERIEQLGGKLIVESTPGEGTAIVAELRVTGGSGGIEEIR